MFAQRIMERTFDISLAFLGHILVGVGFRRATASEEGGDGPLSVGWGAHLFRVFLKAVVPFFFQLLGSCDLKKATSSGARAFSTEFFLAPSVWTKMV